MPTHKNALFFAITGWLNVIATQEAICGNALKRTYFRGTDCHIMHKAAHYILLNKAKNVQECDPDNKSGQAPTKA